MKNKLIRRILCTALSVLCFAAPFAAIAAAEATAADKTDSAVLTPTAPGTVVYQNAKAVIDASNTSEGYVMVKYIAPTSQRLKVLITTPAGVQYNYDMNYTNGTDYVVFPLSEGDGAYKIGVYQNISGSSYSNSFTQTITVKLKDSYTAFLYPNQFVNFDAECKTVAKAAELCRDAKGPLDKVSVVYNWVIKNITYDYEKIKTVRSGYLPDVDQILELKKGICFDYAAVMCAMLRSQGVPAKLVVGYAGTAYHAWISVWVDGKGWVNNIIQFDGVSWKLMDPTFASTGKSNATTMKYIGNGKNYSQKFCY